VWYFWFLFLIIKKKKNLSNVLNMTVYTSYNIESVYLQINSNVQKTLISR
jgi:hypothetical protein